MNRQLRTLRNLTVVVPFWILCSPVVAQEKGDEDSVRFEADLSKGLRLRSAEDTWNLHLGGRYLGHERATFGDSGDSDYRTREAFIQLDAEALKLFAFRVIGDFTPVAGEPAARLYELYGRWMPDPAFELTLGLVKMPTGTDRRASLLFIEGIERPIPASFQSDTEPGLMVTGSLSGGFLKYGAALSDGRDEVIQNPLVDEGQPGLDFGTGHFSGKYYLSATIHPFVQSPEELLKGIRVGFFAASNFTSGVDLFDGFRMKSPDFGVVWLSPATGENELFFQGRRLIAGADPAWTAGPFLLRGEFLFRRDRVVRPSTGAETDMDTLSWSALTSLLLTGEQQSVASRISPGSPVDFKGSGVGAIDVHLRVADAHVEKQALDTLGTDFSRFTNRLTSYGAGLNWWPVSNVRLSLEVIQEDYHQRIVVNSEGDRERSLHGVLLRFQVDF